MSPETHLFASWIISVALFAWALWRATDLGHSFVGVFNRRVDAVFAGVLRKWRYTWFKSSGANTS